MSDTGRKPDDDDTDGVGGQACCILEVCCGGDHQNEALTQLIDDRTALNRAQSKEVATLLIRLYDFAPKGTLVAFKRAIAENARKYKPDPGY